jgi:hypothetical protein
LASAGLQLDQADASTRRTARHETYLHIGLLVVLSLLCSWPLLMHGAPDLSHDGVDHARWAKQFATQFWRGDLFPRWFTDINGGFGGPSGFFYPPLTSYASALFWPVLSAHDPGGWLAAGYALALAQILSGVAAYWWLRSLVAPRAALLGAAVYAIAPYHLALDVYVRGASAEAWVFVWFPLVLLSAEALLRRSRWALPSVALSYALAVLSHPTTALCFVAIPTSYVFLFSERGKRFRNTVWMVGALALGVGLNAQYLLPATLDQNKAYVEWQTVGHGDYGNQWIWQDSHELAEMGRYIFGKLAHTNPQIYWESLLKLPFLVVTLTTALAIAALFWVIRSREKGNSLRLARFYGVAALVSLFLMTKLSSLVWRVLPFLKFMQFPFRFNVMLVITIAVLAALAAPYLLSAQVRLSTVLLVVILLSWVGLDAYGAAQGYSIWRSVVPVRAEYFKQLVRTQIDYSTMWPRPGNNDALSDFTAFDSFVAAHPPKTGRLGPVSRLEPVGSVQVVSWAPRHVVLQIESPRDSELTLNHFYYDGWQGRFADGTVQGARPSPDGLIQLHVPQGSYEIVIELPKDRSERAGMAISLFSLVLLVGGTVFSSRHVEASLRGQDTMQAV